MCVTTHTLSLFLSLSPSFRVSLLLARPLPPRLLIGCWSLAGFAPPRDYNCCCCCCSQRGNTREQKFKQGGFPDNTSPSTTCSVNTPPTRDQEAKTSRWTSSVWVHKTDQPGVWKVEWTGVFSKHHSVYFTHTTISPCLFIHDRLFIKASESWKSVFVEIMAVWLASFQDTEDVCEAGRLTRFSKRRLRS